MAHDGTRFHHDVDDRDAAHNRLSIPSGVHEGNRAPFAIERWMVRKLLSLIGNPPMTLELWNGEAIAGDHPDSTYHLRLRDPGALYQLLSNPNMAFGDLYSSGRLEVDGDLADLLTMLYYAADEARDDWPVWVRKLWDSHTPRSTGIDDARSNIHHHYDLGNDFYRLWLDTAEMQYTCAYFEEEGLSLEQAQLAKLEHVCRKLRLQPGQTVVEAGCGWGGLARYMARQYGVRVHAYNISKEQLAYAREEARRQSLDHLIDYIEDDYRNIEGQYDAFVSVGMLEHVGASHYDDMAAVIDRSLKPNGLALLHSIGRNCPRPMNPWIEKRIFPGAYPPSIGEFMSLCETRSFSVLDVENLRLHYAETLEHWLVRYDINEEQVRAFYDEDFVRAWRMYLAGSIAAFRASSLQLFQVVLTHGSNNHVPRNRKHLYQSPAAPEDA